MIKSFIVWTLYCAITTVTWTYLIACLVWGYKR